MEEERDIVTLVDDDGNEYDYEVIDYFEYEDDTYALLIDAETDEDSEDEVAVYIMKTEEDGDETVFMQAEEERMDALTAIADIRLQALSEELEEEEADE